MISARARLERREYGPDLVQLMSEALESAWRQAGHVAQDAELGRLVMAGAIIDQVDLGARRHEDLVAVARKALDTAALLSPRRLPDR
jgi:hypothetical protein